MPPPALWLQLESTQNTPAPVPTDEFDHPGLLRLLVTPRTDVELPTLTRLAFERTSLKLVKHQDIWLNKVGRVFTCLHLRCLLA